MLRAVPARAAQLPCHTSLKRGCLVESGNTRLHEKAAAQQQRLFMSVPAKLSCQEKKQVRAW